MGRLARRFGFGLGPALVASLLGLGGVGPAVAAPSNPFGELPGVQPCPAGLPEGVECRRGRDYLGAWVWMARPAGWRGGPLVVHAHDGPDLGEPGAARSAQDLQRGAFWLRAGWAWVGSSYRQGGVELRAAADDTERARQSFVAEFGEPGFTLLQGQGWGAGVAASVAERFTTPDWHPRRPMSGRAPYSALLLTNGVLAGARSDDVRLDLRVIFQALCANHPRPDEPGYPLWMGYPLIAGQVQPMTREQLAERLNDCTGVDRPAAQRTAAQRRALETITRVTTIPESALLDHLAWATWHFHDIVWRKLKGANPFGNEGVVYRGSGSAETDRWLNQRVDRYRADPAALAALAADIQPSGRIHRPVATLHTLRDPIAFVEFEAQWRQTMEEAGSADNLLQLFTDTAAHDDPGEAAMLATAAALQDWVRSGQRPTPAEVAARCRAPQLRGPSASDCRFLPDHAPRPLDERVPLRRRGQLADLPTPPKAAASAPPRREVVDPREPRLPPAPEPISPLTRPLSPAPLRP